MRPQLALLSLLLAGQARAALPLPAVRDGRVAVFFDNRMPLVQVGDLSRGFVQALLANTSLRALDVPREQRGQWAGCGGEDDCLARLAASLGAMEVLLVRLPTTGDMMLVLKRIDVARRALLARFSDFLPTDGHLADQMILERLLQLYPQEVFARYGKISVKANVDGARVSIDAREEGKTPLREPISVRAPGRYQIWIQKEKHTPFQATMTVMPDAVVDVSARLVPFSTSPAKPAYRRWYVWVLAGVGVAAAVATGVIVYEATHTAPEPPDMTHVPGIVAFK